MRLEYKAECVTPPSWRTWVDGYYQTLEKNAYNEKSHRMIFSHLIIMKLIQQNRQPCGIKAKEFYYDCKYKILKSLI